MSISKISVDKCLWKQVSHEQAKEILHTIIRRQITNIKSITLKQDRWIHDTIEEYSNDQFWSNGNSLAVESKGEKYWRIYEWVDAYVGFGRDLDLNFEKGVEELSKSRDVHLGLHSKVQ